MAAIVDSLLVKRAQSIAPTMGALYAGAMLTGILYGTANIQTFLYYKNFPRDQMFQKCAVALLWILDSLHMILTIIEFWHYLIDSFGDYDALIALHWSFSLQLAAGVLIILVVQRHVLGVSCVCLTFDILILSSLYTRRIWILSSNRYQRIWSWILIAVLMASYTAGFIFLVDLNKVSTLVQLSRLRWSIIFGLAISSFDDVLLAAAICHLLSLRQTAFEETKSKIWTIMSYAVVSGALTSFAMIEAANVKKVGYHAAQPDISGYRILGAETYLAMLNARKSVSERRTSTSVNMMQFSDFQTSRHLVSHSDSISGFHRSMVESKDPPSSATARLSRPVEVMVEVVHGIDHADISSPSPVLHRERNYRNAV
ncbi:hypothetical protein F5887DRAFT_1174971 [Amanita rubescens]|nr:hypothetical protein F5887DRAFT_1174971 [Amanita rubescens]